MIIDSFPFFNELDVLEIRLRELWDVVDWFVLVEANQTQCSNPKPYIFEDNKARFEKYMKKIAHVKIQDYPPRPYVWAMEHYQRNKIWEGVKILPKLKSSDLLMISDCDEIPSPYQVLEAAEHFKNDEDAKRLSLALRNCAFKLNLQVEGKDWVGPAMTRVAQIEYNEPQDFRDYKDHMVFNTQNKGWHFSYIGGKEKVYQKFFSCIEPMDKNLIPSYEEFSERYDRKIRDGGSFLFSDKEDDSVKLIKYNNSELPEAVKNSSDFNHLLI